MFEPIQGQYYDTIQTDNVASVIRIIDRLSKTSRTYTILNSDDTHIVVVCQMEYDASDIAREMIMSGFSFEYHHIKFGG